MTAIAPRIPRDGIWRLWMLHFRGRRLVSSVTVIVVLAGLFGLLRQWAAVDADGGWGEFEITKQFVIVQMTPALLAGIIGMSCWSPLGEFERVAAFPLWLLRLVQVAVLTLIALSVAQPFLSQWESRSAGVALVWVVARNLLALTGVALLIGWAFDARWSWVGPLACATFAIARVFRVQSEVLWQGEWIAATQDDVMSWIVSAVLLAIGLGLFLQHGARDVAGEEE